MSARSRRALISLLLGVLMVTLVAAPGESRTRSGPAKRTYAIKACDQTKYKPRSFTIAGWCWADAGIYAHKSHWRYWDREIFGTRWAKARTKIFIDNCQPDCASGHFHHRPARVWLTGRGWCKTVHRFVYRLQLIKYVGPEKGVGPDVQRWPHGWHWLGCPRSM